MKTTLITAILAALAAFAALAVHAEEARPVLAEAQALAGDAAACTMRHPAVKRRVVCPTVASIDANTFIVQPPASVTWTLATPTPVYASVPAATAR